MLIGSGPPIRSLCAPKSTGSSRIARVFVSTCLSAGQHDHSLLVFGREPSGQALEPSRRQPDRRLGTCQAGRPLSDAARAEHPDLGAGNRDGTVAPCALLDWRGRAGLDCGMAAEAEPPRVWAIAGSYFEACNCEAICPCRQVGEHAGGRSTYGICQFALSWQIGQGRAGGLRVDDLAVVMAGWYDEDEPGSPWRVSLYLDRRASQGSTRRSPRSSWAGRAALLCAISRPLSAPYTLFDRPHCAVARAPALVHAR